MSVIFLVVLLIYLPIQLVNCSMKINLTSDYYSIIPEKFYQLDKVELILMHNLIFKAIQFDDEMCEFTFQVSLFYIKRFCYKFNILMNNF